MKAVGLILFLFPFSLFAFPSSVYWTTCTTDVVPPGKGVIQTANYFSIFNRTDHHECLPTDIGVSFGFMKLGDFEFEAGIDYYAGCEHPWYFNAKAGINEDKLFSEAPSFSLGIFNFGTSGKTNFNVVDAVIGKTLPCYLSGGRFFLGGFLGSHTLGPDRAGYMFGYYKKFFHAVDCKNVEYDKVWLLADYSSGKNFDGGGGVGFAYFFTSDVYVSTGPAWFNDAHFNGRWKWSLFLSAGFSAFEINPCFCRLGRL